MEVDLKLFIESDSAHEADSKQSMHVRNDQVFNSIYHAVRL